MIFGKDRYTMFFDDLTGAKKSVQQLGKRAGLDASAKKHLAKIADAFGQAEERLKALEAVVEELAVGAKLKTVRGPRANSNYVAKLLGRDRT
jgi:ABC-type Fe3+-hydroxamate transport system substrate-binding protein